VSATIILGGTGFVGSRIAAALTRRGLAAQAIGSDQLDLTDADRVAAAARQWGRDTTLIHCAALTPSRDASWHAAKDNLAMTDNLAAAIPAEGLRGLLFLSSSAVYAAADRGHVISETDDLKPSSPYGFSKAESEAILAKAAWARKTPFLTLRPSILFGEGDGGRSLLGRWTDDVMASRPVAVKGKGMARIDLLDVEDLCGLVAHWADKPFGGALNIASGQPLTVLDAIKRVGQSLGKEAVIDRQTRSSELEHDLVFDLERLRSIMPAYSPASIELTLRDYVLSRAGASSGSSPTS
jgi:UDP-glucose 4-epimerase